MFKIANNPDNFHNLEFIEEGFSKQNDFMFWINNPCKIFRMGRYVLFAFRKNQ